MGSTLPSGTDAAEVQLRSRCHGGCAAHRCAGIPAQSHAAQSAADERGGCVARASATRPHCAFPWRWNVCHLGRGRWRRVAIGALWRLHVFWCRLRAACAHRCNGTPIWPMGAGARGSGTGSSAVAIRRRDATRSRALDTSRTRARARSAVPKVCGAAGSPAPQTGANRPARVGRSVRNFEGGETAAGH